MLEKLRSGKYDSCIQNVWIEEYNYEKSVNNDRTKCIFQLQDIIGSGQRRVPVGGCEGGSPTDGQQVAAGFSTVSRERQNASERRPFILYQEPADACQVMLLSTNN